LLLSKKRQALQGESLMLLLHIVILAVVQGITEFLPVSSSGHLVLSHALLGTDEAHSRMLDIAVHVGTLFSALLYFRRDLFHIGRAALHRDDSQGKVLGRAVLIGSLPVIVIGFIVHRIDPAWLYSLPVMAWCTLIFGIILWWVDQRPQDKKLEQIGWRAALWIGLAQVLALVPGTSRSGVTMGMARLLGFNRSDAARFSLLLAIVAISGAGVLGGLDLIATGDSALNMYALLAAGLAFVAGYAAIALMMRWLAHASFTPFAIYRIFLGGLLLILLYSGVIS